MHHESFMHEALKEGEKARYLAPPNPWVGCVLVKEGIIVGKGHTQIPGQAHAEIKALAEAGSKAKGAVLYSTLEPCCHYGRTPPCVDALIRAGISEVYAAIEDPDALVNGAGIAALRHAGIKVSLGICRKEAERQLEPYLYHRKTGMPFTWIKSAVSMDGRSAAEDGSSQWITCLEARKDSHILRAQSQAILIGSGTALKDSPSLTVRTAVPFSFQPPLRILLDSRGRVPAEGPLFDTSLAPTLVITSDMTSSIRISEWRKKEAEVEVLSSNPSGLDLLQVWKYLGRRSILQLLVEGGPTLQTACLASALCNHLTLYIGPKLLGKEGLPSFLESFKTIQEALSFRLIESRVLENTIRADYSNTQHPLV